MFFVVLNNKILYIFTFVKGFWQRITFMYFKTLCLTPRNCDFFMCCPFMMPLPDSPTKDSDCIIFMGLQRSVVLLVCFATSFLWLWIFTYARNALCPQFCFSNTFHATRSIQMPTLLQNLSLRQSAASHRKSSFSALEIIRKFFKSFSHTCSIINFSMSIGVFSYFWDSWKQSYGFHSTFYIVGFF